MIHTCATRLLDLVDNIMQLSQLQSNKFSLVVKPIKLQAVVEEVCLLLEFACDKHGRPLRKKEVQIINDVHPELPCVVADASRVAQMYVYHVHLPRTGIPSLK